MSIRTYRSAIILQRAASLLILISITGSTLWSQDRTDRRQAMLHFQNGRYQEALPLFQDYCESRPRDVEANHYYAMTLYEVNRLPQAISILEPLTEPDGREAGPMLLTLARCYHQHGAFLPAIRMYKRFLASGDYTQAERRRVINDIKRCSVGIRYDFKDSDILVENMGKQVNSSFDDFGPIESPNIENKIYFSTLRNLRIADQFSDDGELMGSMQSHDVDMYATEIQNGAWASVAPLNEALNTPHHEILLGFAVGGDAAIFNRGPSVDETIVYVDSFSSSGSDEGSFWDDNPFDQRELLQGLQFWSDSLILFSSDREGGFGGFDVYMLILTENGWSEAINMGKEINGPYDEVTPFMAVDGRTLYYSRNDLSSMGGFDVFSSTFSEEELEWLPPTNLGQPINSPGDDLHFILSKDGQSAYFSSDRKTGHGCQDLYSAYFKEKQWVQLNRSIPPLFYQVSDFQLFAQNLSPEEDSAPEKSPTLSRFEVPHLLFRDDQVLTPQNRQKLEKLIGFLTTYPHVSIEIVAHSDQEEVSNFDLYFSIRRAEQIANYLIQRGVDGGKIYMKGVGGNYPLARNHVNGKPYETGQYFNRRIDFRIQQLDQLPMEVHYTFPELTEAMSMENLSAFYSALAGLTYRVEFAQMDQLYKGNLIGRFSDPAVEKVPDSTDYFYTSGIFSSFEPALAHLAVIKGLGFDQSKVVPYLNGIRVGKDALDESVLEEYPDLKNYILYLN